MFGGHLLTKRRIILFILILALVLLVVGLVTPAMTLRKFIFFGNTVSIFSGLVTLFEEGRYGLFFVIFVFSVVFPIAKNVVLLAICRMPDWGTASVKKWMERVSRLGRWSMLDVFVVALLVVVVELGVIATVEVHAGIFFFGASVLLTNGTALFMERQVRHNALPADENAPREGSPESISQEEEDDDE